MAVSETTPTIDPNQEITVKRAMTEVMHAQHNKKNQQAEAAEAETEDAVLNDEQQLEASRELHREQLTDPQRKMQELQSNNQAKTSYARYEGLPGGSPPPKIALFPFAIMLALALMKDIIDFIDWGILGTVLNIIPIMGILLLVSITGGSLRTFISKRKYLIGSGAALEFIPIIGFLPLWTLTVLWLYLDGRYGGHFSGQAFTMQAKNIAKNKRVQNVVKKFKK